MRYTVEVWDPDYGAPSSPDLEDASENVDVSVEKRPDEWEPILPDVETLGDLLFVDGVRRVDASLWIEQPPDFPGFALAATYAAGAVRCNGRAVIESAAIGRGLFTSAGAEDIDSDVGTYEVKATKGTTPEELWLGIQQRMADLEAKVARSAGPAEVIVVDGPLSHHREIKNAVGYIKTQKVQYLPMELRPVLTSLLPGYRTPLFLTTTSWSRYSWYLRLANHAGPAGGLVRCEIDGDMEIASAVRLANRVSATLPRFASDRHKDPRAPQNLYPIGGLERDLKHRLGDRELAIRALRRAAAA
ncbi:MAG: DNA double-strand break repair nuclease NurA [Acidimicrobiia bacterium]|nr:DNA double-strand break repair nuclease NurA [Acidimicrobiia bacterium]